MFSSSLSEIGYQNDTSFFSVPLLFFGSEGRGFLLPFEFFCLFEGNGVVEDDVLGEAVFLGRSFSFIASSTSFLMCCSMLFWFVWETLWIASAVASVALMVSSRLNFAAINVVSVCVSSCRSNSSCSLKVFFLFIC